MVGWQAALSGDGLVRAHNALLALQDDPVRLDQSLHRFSRSPSLHSSTTSVSTTSVAGLASPRRVGRAERRYQLALAWNASKPYNQLERQIREEADQIQARERIPIGSDAESIAYERVRQRWHEQGIWNPKWNHFAAGRWKHEEPLVFELSNQDVAPSALRQSSLFSHSPERITESSPPDDNCSKQNEADQAIKIREREASRPINQFLYQMSEQRKRLGEEKPLADGVWDPDINTKAYVVVKNVWKTRGIWDKRWLILPGMSWKHEEPFEEPGEDIPISPDSIGPSAWELEAADGPKYLKGLPCAPRPSQTDHVPHSNGVSIHGQLSTASKPEQSAKSTTPTSPSEAIRAHQSVPEPPESTAPHEATIPDHLALVSSKRNYRAEHRSRRTTRISKAADQMNARSSTTNRAEEFHASVGRTCPPSSSSSVPGRPRRSARLRARKRFTIP